MNILYLYHEYGNRRKKYGEIMKYLGNNVKYYNIKRKLKDKSIPIHTLNGIDLVWTLSTFYNYSGIMDEEFISTIKKKGILLATYTTISTQVPLKEWSKTYEIYDYVFLQNKQIVGMLDNKKIRYIPLGYHPDQYYPLNNKKLKHDISFMGSPQTTVPVEQDLRCKILNQVGERFAIKIYGKEFAKRFKGLKIYKFKTNRKQRNIYNSTLINLNISYINSTLEVYRNVLHLKNRFFEIPACKSFLLTQRFPEAEEIFKDNIHCAYYNNIEDLLYKIEYYLKNPNQAREIAERGYVEVKNKHTYWHRFREMFEIIKN